MQNINVLLTYVNILIHNFMNSKHICKKKYRLLKQLLMRLLKEKEESTFTRVTTLKVKNNHHLCKLLCLVIIH